MAPAKDLTLDRERRSETLWHLARVFRDLKLPQEAERIDAERNELWKSRPPEELVDLALKHLSQATMIGYGKMPLSDRAAAVRELDLDQAAGEVKLAVSSGLKDLASSSPRRSRAFCCRDGRQSPRSNSLKLPAGPRAGRTARRIERP